jgi:poly-gamma-glutamate synthesis protein (capsule biosynthesis protein)
MTAVRSALVAVLVLAGCTSGAAGSEPPQTVAESGSGSAGPAAERGTGAEGAFPAYVVRVHRIGPGLRTRMHDSYRPGCPVPLRELRYLRLRFVGFDGRAHLGELVVRKRFATDVGAVFERLYDARWPIRRMRLVDDYAGVDERSMAADNTAGFNCRRIAGGAVWSRHAYGEAIDVNPAENPYLTASAVHPRSASRFVLIDRSLGARVPTGSIRADDVVVRAFASIGWEWGGAWTGLKDYQHFAAPAG